MTSALTSKLIRLDTTSDRAFLQLLSAIGGLYLLLLAAMLVADVFAVKPADFLYAMRSKDIRYAMQLSMFSCFVTATLSLLVSVPLAYVMSRVASGIWRHIFDALLDVPFVFPPVVVGLSLLLMFNTPLGHAIQRVIPFTYAVPGVILAQFVVACAFALRVMRSAMEAMPPRYEQVALTLGCSRAQAFLRIVLPYQRRAMLAAFTLAWARALGEFGPVMIFAGTIRMHTEVLPTSVYFELEQGTLGTSVAVALLMIVFATLAMVAVRLAGMSAIGQKERG